MSQLVEFNNRRTKIVLNTPAIEEVEKCYLLFLAKQENHAPGPAPHQSRSMLEYPVDWAKMEQSTLETNSESQ